MIIKDIIARLYKATNLSPVVKGGNRSNPLEYEWSRTGRFNYRLTIWTHGRDILGLQTLSDEIVNAIADFGDYNDLNGSIELTGGGSFEKDDTITNVLYFNVVEYPRRGHGSDPTKDKPFTMPFGLPDKF